jgi:hypothetical protein
MYAVIAIFTMDAAKHAQQLQFLRERIVPGVSQKPGFVAGYWTYDGRRSYNTLVFDSREAAEAQADDVRGNLVNQTEAGVVPATITVAEVIANA